MKDKLKLFKTALIVCLLFTTMPGFSQYYYRDFISRKQAENEMVNYREAKVKNIVLTSYEADGSPSRGFMCEKKVNKNFNGFELFTRTNLNGPSLFTTSYNADGKLAATYDSSLTSVASTAYSYDATGRLTSTRTRLTSRDDDFHNEIIEEHLYTYADNDHPQKLDIVRNGKDTTTILFAADENGHLAIEKNTKTGSKYFYIYNAKDQLTQIAQETALRRDPFPNYIFNYNNAGKVLQMITTEEGGRNVDYTIWRYTYEDNLKTAERIMSKERKVLGNVEYSYKKGK